MTNFKGDYSTLEELDCQLWFRFIVVVTTVVLMAEWPAPCARATDNFDATFNLSSLCKSAQEWLVDPCYDINLILSPSVFKSKPQTGPHHGEDFPPRWTHQGSPGQCDFHPDYALCECMSHLSWLMPPMHPKSSIILHWRIITMWFIMTVAIVLCLLKCMTCSIWSVCIAL